LIAATNSSHGPFPHDTLCGILHLLTCHSAIAAIGGGLNFITPYKRPFSLLDLSISFPFFPETISITTVGLVSIVAPGVIIAVVALLLVPGPKYSRQLSRKNLLALKLWELEKGLAGLALSVACAFFITQALKNLFGKPRPNCIAACMPDLSRVAEHTIGGYGQSLDPRWTLVSATICTNPDTSVVNDAFRSFPSGHCTVAWAGMLYLTLFLCSKFAIAVPHLPEKTGPSRDSGPLMHEQLPLHEGGLSSDTFPSTSGPHQVSVRNLAASPPNHLIAIAFVPIAVACYICASRFFDFYHHGFDIISGSLIGIVSSYLAFRWYHLPLARGQGWAWGPRSRDRAFGIGVGVGTYA